MELNMQIRKTWILSLIILLSGTAWSQTEADKPQEPPEWLSAHMDFLSQGSGCWQTSNAEYQSDDELFDTYYNHWQAGIGGTTHLKGRLYGQTGDQMSADFWDFISYWDGNQGQAVVLQLGRNGIVGDGSMWQVAAGRFVQEQVFSLPDGRTWKTRHDLEEAGESFITTSLDWEDGEWKQRRTYTWLRCGSQT